MKMRLYILILSLSCLSVFACKAKHKPVKQASETVVPMGTTFGKVSHQYRKTGCATVIIVNNENKDKPLTLIPKDTLSPVFDIDGLEVLFNYRALKMPNPKGCSIGIPAEIKDISKK